MNKKQRMYAQIENHGQDLIKAFSLPTDTDPIALCKRLFRMENEANRIMVDYCNGDVGAEQVEAYRGKLEKRLAKIVGKGNMGIVYINQDPRGYTLKLTSEASKTAEIHKDMGGYGILAPDFNE